MVQSLQSRTEVKKDPTNYTISFLTPGHEADASYESDFYISEVQSLQGRTEVEEGLDELFVPKFAQLLDVIAPSQQTGRYSELLVHKSEKSKHPKLKSGCCNENKHSGSIPKNACVACENIAMRDYQESVNTGQTHRQTPDKVIPVCRYALQPTQ